jgi:type III pantothenate kinase
MLLAVDIQNSVITLGGYHGQKLIFSGRMASELSWTDDQIAVSLNSILHLYHITPTDIDSAIISCVVPGLTGTVFSAVRKLFGCTPLVLGPGVKTGLNILIDNPAQLGGDLVATEVAAVANYPVPCIIFSLGAATTVSVINKDGTFIGAIISAGIGTSLDSLTRNAALLPHISIEKPPTLIGKNSVHSIQSGLIYGTSVMIDGLVDQIEGELGGKATLLSTGEYAELIVPHCRHAIRRSENLLLDGLCLIYDKNRPKQ